MSAYSLAVDRDQRARKRKPKLLRRLQTLMVMDLSFGHTDQKRCRTRCCSRDGGAGQRRSAWRVDLVPHMQNGLQREWDTIGCHSVKADVMSKTFASNCRRSVPGDEWRGGRRRHGWEEEMEEHGGEGLQQRMSVVSGTESDRSAQTEWEDVGELDCNHLLLQPSLHSVPCALGLPWVLLPDRLCSTMAPDVCGNIAQQLQS